MNKLNVATLTGNFFRVYYFERKGNTLTGVSFFTIPVKPNLVKNAEVLNVEDTKSLLLPQIARASDQIRYKETVYVVPTAEVYSTVVKFEGAASAEQIFEQLKGGVKYTFDQALVLMKQPKNGEMQVYVARAEYVQMVKDIFKSGTFKLTGIVPITEVLANITNDVGNPHILVAKVESDVLIVLINNNHVHASMSVAYIEAKELKTADIPAAEPNSGPEPEIASEIITADHIVPKVEEPQSEPAAPSTPPQPSPLVDAAVVKKVTDAVAKLQAKARDMGIDAHEVYLADRFTREFQNGLAASTSTTQTEPVETATAQVPPSKSGADSAEASPAPEAGKTPEEGKQGGDLTSEEGTPPVGGLQTSPNVVKIVQVPFDEGLDSTAFTMILPNETYSKKGVNFGTTGDSPTVSQEPPTGNKKHMGKVIIVVLVVLLLGGGGVWFFLQSRAAKSTSSDISPTPAQSETPITVTVSQASASASPTPSVTLERKNLKVQVYNGFTKTGEASRIKGVLEGKGYVVVGAGNNPGGNAETTTTVQLKPTKKEYFSLIKQDLASEYAVTQGTDLPESNAADAVVIVGEK